MNCQNVKGNQKRNAGYANLLSTWNLTVQKSSASTATNLAMSKRITTKERLTTSITGYGEWTQNGERHSKRSTEERLKYAGNSNTQPIKKKETLTKFTGKTKKLENIMDQAHLDNLAHLMKHY